MKGFEGDSGQQASSADKTICDPSDQNQAYVAFFTFLVLYISRKGKVFPLKKIQTLLLYHVPIQSYK